MALALHLVWPCGQLMERQRAIRTEGGGDAEEPRALLAGNTSVRGGSLGARGRAIYAKETQLFCKFLPAHVSRRCYGNLLLYHFHEQHRK